MWTNVVVMLLKIALNFLVPMFFGKSAEKELYERRLKASIYLWERKAGRSTKLRDDHRAIEEKLDKAWEEKWGKKK